MIALRISIILLVIIVISSFAYISVLDKTADRFVAQIDQLEKSVNDENWNEAQQQMKDMEKGWEKTEKWMTTLIDHNEVDSIKMTLSRASQYVHYKKTADFMAESAVLRHQINHIPDTEKINIPNLF